MKVNHPSCCQRIGNLSRIFLISVSVVFFSELGANDLEKVLVTERPIGFALSPSGKRFVPWGNNYASVDIMKRLAEEPERVTREFAEMKSAGTTVARIHPEMPSFFSAPNQIDPQSLEQFRKLLKIAEESGVRLQITGLACYKTATRMTWYDAFDEAKRWKTQALFWETIAQICAESPAVFAYDLLNEPGAVGDSKNGWYMGRMGDVDFCQYLTLDAKGRSGDDIFRDWTKLMISAIRKHDSARLVTMGMLPFPGAYKALAPQLDFVSPHLYPKAGKVKEELDLLRQFDWGRPIVIGETFPLECSRDEERDFLLQSRPLAQGWIGHWPDESPTKLEEMRKAGTGTVTSEIWRAWVELFREIGPQMIESPTP